jgi:IclR family transcriptional regulator, KDG regulon repressor
MSAPSITVSDESPDVEPPKERNSVQSIERAFAILTEISKQQGISLAELSKKVALHNSTTFHLVRTMVDLGIVRQEKQTKRYLLGRKIFTLAAASLSELQLVSVATPVLEELAAATGETAHFGIRSGDQVAVAARIIGTGAFQLVERSGAGRPLHCTALGKVLLAQMNDEQLRRFVDTFPLTPSTPKSITDPHVLFEEVRTARTVGLGYDDGEFNAEVRCVAAPVFDFRGQNAGAIGISGPIWRITLQRLQELAEKVRAGAAEISRELGYTER